MHRVALSKIPQDLVDDTFLRRGQLIGQPAQERSGQLATRIMGEPGGFLGLLAFPQREGDLETEELVVGQSLPGGTCLIEGVRKVDPGICLVPGQQTVGGEDHIGHRIRDGSGPAQGVGHPVDELEWLHLPDLRVDRDDSTGVERLPVAVEDRNHRVGHLETAAVRLDRPGKRRLVPGESCLSRKGWLNQTTLSVALSSVMRASVMVNLALGLRAAIDFTSPITVTSVPRGRGRGAGDRSDRRRSAEGDGGGRPHSGFPLARAFSVSLPMPRSSVTDTPASLLNVAIGVGGRGWSPPANGTGGL